MNRHALKRAARVVAVALLGGGAALAQPVTNVGPKDVDYTGSAAPDDQAASVVQPKAVTRPAPLPPPTEAQRAGLAALQRSIETYESAAAQLREVSTQIVQAHFEARKAEIFAAIDVDLGAEKAELSKARSVAVARLEDFVAKYNGGRAHPEATPDAMYRLAALYEEVARAESTPGSVENGIRKSIGLYKKIIASFPSYKEIAGVYYFLGHALNDIGRTHEAMGVWRSLVCFNHYPYPSPTAPNDPERDVPLPMPQDHDEAYWTAWRARYADPRTVSRSNPDTVYDDVFFGQDCRPVPSVEAGSDRNSKYLAESWWQIGNWEFDQLDAASGVTKTDPVSVWAYNRAASAYRYALNYKKPPIYGVALYKYAWTLYKQQRFQDSARGFVDLLAYADEQQKRTGDAGTDFRNEALTYLAGALTNVDFVGPEPWEPFVERPDIVDTEPRAEVVERKLRVAIDRVQDASIIPQDKPWTIDVYRALGREFRQLSQLRNAIDVYEMVIARWPLDPSAPETQSVIADVYDALAALQRAGTPQHDALVQKALEARTNLASYTGDSPWVAANRGNAAAMHAAERLVRSGLRQAAAQHTNNGKAALLAASETSDRRRQVESWVRAQAEYRWAATGWAGYLRQDENAPDSYESRYWLADARHQAVRIAVDLHASDSKRFAEPGSQQISEALAAAVDVRDSTEDDAYLENAGFFAVDVSDVNRDLAYERAARGEPRGVEPRTEIKFDGADTVTRTPLRDPIPAVVRQSMRARDEYVLTVPASFDTQKRALAYRYYVAEQLFLYGHFDEARERFEPLWKEHCGVDEWGYRAWEKLITMSNLERDAKRSIELAQAEKTRSCAANAEQTARSGAIINPTIQEAAFVKAREQFEKACEAKIGQPCVNAGAPEKRPTWLAAAQLYEAALAAAPARDEAPEAAMNAAFAYKQIGQYNKAIELYSMFIANYGSESRLVALQRGDAKSKSAPDLRKYNERIAYLTEAYSALAEAYYSFFSYQRAAETYADIAANARLPEVRRRDAAKNALVLFANLGQRDKLLATYGALLQASPSADERASADFAIASFDYKQWSATQPDSGQNRQHRLAAEQSLTAYFQAQRSNRPSAKYAVEAAFSIAKLKKSVGDEGATVWLRNTVAAWESFKAVAPVKDGKSEAQTSPVVDWAAEAEFTLLDEQISARFDLPSKHRYAPNVPDIFGEVSLDPKTKKPVVGSDGKPVMKKQGKYQMNAAEADAWDLALSGFIKKYESLEWIPVAVARQGALFDTLRTGLYNMVKVDLFSPAQKALLDQMHESGRPDLDETANAIEDGMTDFWRQKKQLELDGADRVMVMRYATAIAYARRFNLRHPFVTRAVRRLAYYTDVLSGGDAKMAEFVTSAPDPTQPSGAKMSYSPRQYAQSRPGLAATVPVSGAPVPAPALGGP